MEHQDSVTLPFYGIIAAYSVFVVGYSIHVHDAQILLWGFGVLLAAVAVWWLLAVLNIVIFPPIFRLLAKLTSKHNVKESDRGNDKPA